MENLDAVTNVFKIHGREGSDPSGRRYTALWVFLLIGAILIVAISIVLSSLGLNLVFGSVIKQPFRVPIDLVNGRYAIVEAAANAIALVLLCIIFGTVRVTMFVIRAWSIVGAGLPGALAAVVFSVAHVFLEQQFLATYDREHAPQKSACISSEGNIRLVPLLRSGELDRSMCWDNHVLSRELFELYERQSSGRETRRISADEDPSQRQFFRGKRALAFARGQGETLELFDGPGWDRLSAALLRPVTERDVAIHCNRFYARQARTKEEEDRFLEFFTEEIREASVLVFFRNGEPPFPQHMISKLTEGKGRGREVVREKFFEVARVRDAARKGDWSDFRKVKYPKALQTILIVEFADPFPSEQSRLKGSPVWVDTYDVPKAAAGRSELRHIDL